MRLRDTSTLWMQRADTWLFVDSGTARSERTTPNLRSENDMGSSHLYHQFLTTLKFHGRGREEGITDAYMGTFQWIWTSDFPSWLSVDGSPLFWIRGKPGSGKSTLMRHIWDHDELSRLLNSGPHGRPMIKAAFFFYYRGSYVQKSFEGMLHSILFRILEQEPRLAEILLPEFAELESGQRNQWTWTLPKLMAAYGAILAQQTIPVDLLLFIDALDEYDGPPEAIVEFIRSSVEKSSQGTTRVKVCFSSREWTAFEEDFSRESGVRIHEHTTDDIHNYISSRLQTDLIISQKLVSGTEDVKSDIREMQQTLVDRANGVFIWVKAVLDEVCRRFHNRTPTSELLLYLKGVPDDLDRLYTDAIKRIPHEYRMQTYFMFEIILRSTDRSLRPTEIMEAVSCAGLHSLGDCVRAIEETRAHSDFNDCDRWIKDRGVGLIEVVPDLGESGNGSNPCYIVGFMHQTTLDFVSQPGFRGVILGGAFALPLENGYTFLSKWLFSRAEEEIKRPSSPACPTSPAVGVLARAESTTGRSMKSFLDALDTRVIRQELNKLHLPSDMIVDPKQFRRHAVSYNLPGRNHQDEREKDNT